jgi:hydroxymethylpyrimidine pyrophosphatase-like HAD family hydrolase
VPVWDEILEPGFDGVIASAGGYVEYEGKVLLHRSLPVEEVRHVVEFFDRHGVEYLLESNSGLYGSRRARERLRELIFGGVTDEDILAELEKGLGGFIDSLVIDPDPVRSDINKISFLDSPLTIEQIRAEFAGALHIIHATVPMFGPNSGEMSIPGIHKATAIELLIEHAGMARVDTIAPATASTTWRCSSSWRSASPWATPPPHSWTSPNSSPPTPTTTASC